MYVKSHWRSKRGLSEHSQPPHYLQAWSGHKQAKNKHNTCMCNAVMLVWGLLFRTVKAAYANMYIETFAISLFLINPWQHEYGVCTSLSTWLTVMSRHKAPFMNDGHSQLRLSSCFECVTNSQFVVILRTLEKLEIAEWNKNMQAHSTSHNPLLRPVLYLKFLAGENLLLNYTWLHRQVEAERSTIIY